MKILSHHVGKQVILATLLVLLLLTGLEVFIEFLGETNDIGRHNYGLTAALLYVPLSLPKSLYQLFPIAGLIGGLMGLGMLASKNELTVMRAAGVSKLQITWMVVKAALLLLIGITFLGEFLAPKAGAWADNFKNTALTGYSNQQAVHKDIWLRQGSQFIYINRIDAEGHLHDLLNYRINTDGRLLSASIAKQGVYQQQHWLLTDISSSLFQNNRVTTQHLAHEIWPVRWSPKQLGVDQLNSDLQTLPQLKNYIHFRQQMGLQTNSDRLAFWKRIFQPFTTLVMICLAIPFIFGPLRSVTIGLRIVTGVAVGFSFYIINELFGPLSLIYQFPPLLAALLPTLLFAGFGLLLVKWSY